jgi:hypothetical protein
VKETHQHQKLVFGGVVNAGVAPRRRPPAVAVQVVQAEGEARTVQLAAAERGQRRGQLVEGDLFIAVCVEQRKKARAHEVVFDT